jgi:prevent-host-death family protein
MTGMLPMPDSPTISATEFKAKCLDLLDRVGRGELPRLIVTKRGTPVAVVTPPPVEDVQIERLLGWMRGSVIIPPDFDLTEPFCDEPFAAEEGELYR